MIQQYIETGKIVGTHGVKGMVRVQPWSDSGNFLRKFSRFFLDDLGQDCVTVQKIQPHGNVVLMAFNEIETIESAEALRGKILYINRKDVCLPKGRYFVSDLLGCAVFNAENGTSLGILGNVSKTGANDVWHIMQNGREYLVPAVAEVLVSVEPEKGRIVIHPMKGIFDDED